MIEGKEGVFSPHRPVSTGTLCSLLLGGGGKLLNSRCSLWQRNVATANYALAERVQRDKYIKPLSSCPLIASYWWD